LAFCSTKAGQTIRPSVLDWYSQNAARSFYRRALVYAHIVGRRRGGGVARLGSNSTANGTKP
jgi:hypothetical protein